MVTTLLKPRLYVPFTRPDFGPRFGWMGEWLRQTVAPGIAANYAGRIPARAREVNLL